MISINKKKDKMKKNVLKTLGLLVAVLTMGCGLIACDSDTTIDENGNTVNKLEKFFSTNVTRCERVGSVLQVEFTLKSLKQDYNQVTISGTSTDNVGKSYQNIISQSGSDFDNGQTFRMKKDDEVPIVLKLREFDPNNRAKNVDVKLTLRADDDLFDTNELKLGTLTFVDNRVLDNGIQTCDTGLEFKLDSCRLGADDKVYGSFVVTNRTGETLRNMWFFFQSFLEDASGHHCVDNLNTRHMIDLSLDHETFRQSVEFNLQDGASQLCFFRVNDVSPKPATLTWDFKVGSEYLDFSDDRVRFLTIPIEK